MHSVTINGVDLDIPRECLSPQIIDALKRGKYEHVEAAAMRRHLVPSDRMVDLGAGAGYLVSLASRVVGGANVLGIEANPVMAAAAEVNLHRNSGGTGRVLHGAVMPDDFAGDTVRFLARRPFWGGYVDATTGTDNALHIEVPVLRIGQIMAEHQPTLVTMDIEGAEADLAHYRWPGHVRMVILEIHVSRYPAATLQAVLNGFFNSGLTYCPWGSRGQIWIFERPEALPG